MEQYVPERNSYSSVCPGKLVGRPQISEQLNSPPAHDCQIDGYAMEYWDLKILPTEPPQVFTKRINTIISDIRQKKQYPLLLYMFKSPIIIVIELEDCTFAIFALVFQVLLNITKGRKCFCCIVFYNPLCRSLWRMSSQWFLKTPYTCFPHSAVQSLLVEWNRDTDHFNSLTRAIDWM